MTTPADWYPDPEDAAGLRYWDGANWTEHRASATPPRTPAVETPVTPATHDYASPGEPPEAEAGHEPGSPEGPNRRLAYRIIAVAAAILVVIVVVLVVVVMRKGEPTVTSSPTTSSTVSATSNETTPESSAAQTPTPPPSGAQGSDGAYTFSVARTETGPTITSTVSGAVETATDGLYYVVHLNVANTGTAPLTFTATFQALSAGGQTFPLDDAATAFLGGTVANVDPGAQVETALVYDVPVGTEPDSILLKADPSSAGVELPLR